MTTPNELNMSDQPVWTDADFDRMSWHDNHVHGLQVRSGADGLGEVIFDIDYIVEWLCAVGDVDHRFRVAPATLTFRDVSDLQLHLDYAAADAAVVPFSIGDVKRTWISFPTGAGTFEWTIEVNWPRGSISFHASGFIQVLCGPIQLTSEQWLESPERIAH